MMEILAPSGSFECLQSAVYSGANAVYLGMENFNARSKASNFNKNNLAEAVHFAHLFGVKVYCTFNTLIKDNEITEVLNDIDFAHNCKVDAIILQDLGLIKAISDTMPHIVMHASTQMGIHNLEGAIQIEKMGMKRVILSRETFLEDIKKIHAGTNLEIEFFVQGALCVAFSGNCYFSSLISGYSGNRGKCMQLCRKQYTLTNGDREKTGYFLSAKDLCLLEDLKILENAGVISLKIEGRMRSPEYVSECVRIYKKAINNCDISKTDIDDLKIVFNRGEFCKAHLYNLKGSTIYSPIQNNMGLSVGSVKEIKSNLAILNLNKKLSVGDGVKYLKNGKEVACGLITNNNNTTTYKGDLQGGEDVRLTSSVDLVQKVKTKENKLKITIKAYFHCNEIPKIIIQYQDVLAICFGQEQVQLAENQPLSLDRIKNNLSKFGGTHFEVSQIDIYMDENIFFPISSINAIRREAQVILEKKICEKIENNVNNSNTTHTVSDIEKNNWVKLSNKSNLFIQLDNLLVKKSVFDIADYVVFNPSCYDLETIKDFKKIYKEKSVLNLPIVARGMDVEILRNIIDNSGIDIFIVNNLYAIELCKNKKIIGGFALNQLNNFITNTKISSIENDHFDCSLHNILYAYGYEVFMTLCHCPKYDLDENCSVCNHKTSLKIYDDRNQFNLRRVKIANCYWQLVNSIPLNLLYESKKIANRNVFLDFSNIDDAIEIENVLNCFLFDNDLNDIHTHGNYGKKLY